MKEIMEKAGENNPMNSLPYDANKYGTNTMGSGAGPAPPFRN